jgi:hypothetical protein
MTILGVIEEFGLRAVQGDCSCHDGRRTMEPDRSVGVVPFVVTGTEVANQVREAGIVGGAPRRSSS